ncbi:hypothetical protein CFU_3206 [Collimonas fungivorans Ter331]|uniref:Uncharacterized protein n=1 Tax=Collimonas fungivorans (strain Ter331) TaxID=1005048 RepID=G0AA97_COLFT|nr:hypothetical protein CFU_3206 [Collimonas fungivorans Ter331]
MHDHARHPQTRHQPGDQPHAGRVPRRSVDAARVHEHHQPKARRIIRCNAAPTPVGAADPSDQRPVFLFMPGHPGQHGARHHTARQVPVQRNHRQREQRKTHHARILVKHLVQFDADAVQGHVDHAHGGRHGGLRDCAFGQRETDHDCRRQAFAKSNHADRRHQEVRRVEESRAEQHDQHAQGNRIQRDLDRTAQAPAVDLARQHQVAGDQAAEHRDLPVTVFDHAQVAVGHQDLRRHGDPADQRNRQQGHAHCRLQEMTVADHRAVVVPDLHQRQFLFALLDGFRHVPPQADQGYGGNGGDEYKHHAPRQDFNHESARHGADQRRNQGDIGHQRGNAYRGLFFKCFLHHGVADRRNETQAHALQHAQDDEALNALREQRRQAGQDEKDGAAQHDGAAANAVRERPEQPLEHGAADQEGSHGGRHPGCAGAEFAGHRQHARLDHVVGDVDRKLEQHQSQREHQGITGKRRDFLHFFY